MPDDTEVQAMPPLTLRPTTLKKRELGDYFSTMNDWLANIRL